MEPWLDIKTIYTIAHVFGAVLGAGGAFVSDALFFSSLKDRKFSKTEYRLLHVTSGIIWFGLGMLIISGLGLFTLAPTHYLASDKFVAKMVIVGFIIINGIVFHHSHLPRIKRHLDESLRFSREMNAKFPLLITSGVVSFVSWVFTVTLGSLRIVPYSYYTILAVYVVVVLLGVGIGFIIQKRLVQSIS